MRACEAGQDRGGGNQACRKVALGEVVFHVISRKCELCPVQLLRGFLRFFVNITIRPYAFKIPEYDGIIFDRIIFQEMHVKVFSDFP